MRIIHCAPFNVMTKVGGALYANPIKISHGLVENDNFVHNFDYRDSARYFSIFKSKKNGQKKMNEFFKVLVNDLKPDLIIFGHAELIFKDTFEDLKKKNIKMIYWYNDVPIQKYFKEIANYFEFVLTTAGGEFISDLKKFNKNVFFLPNIVNKNIEKYKSYENNNYNYDLFFSGRVSDDRKNLINFLDTNYSSLLKLKFIGQNKENVIIGEKYLELISDSKICINHNRDFTLKYEWYTSDRLMHILGNGSFALSTKIINGEHFFEDKLDYYSSNDELKSKIDYYLKEESLRRRNSEWLRNRVHNLFNSKRIGEYILHLCMQNDKKLDSYEWFK